MHRAGWGGGGEEVKVSMVKFQRELTSDANWQRTLLVNVGFVNVLKKKSYLTVCVLTTLSHSSISH